MLLGGAGAGASIGVGVGVHLGDDQHAAAVIHCSTLGQDPLLSRPPDGQRSFKPGLF